jgi:mannose PTS system EIIA component
MNTIFIIAHTPLASALRSCALHVDPELAHAIAALDVQPHVSAAQSLAEARAQLAQLGGKPQDGTLVLTDLFGATPCNVAQQLVDGTQSKLIAGVNLPMLMRCITYRRESLETLISRAMAGGTQGVMQVAVAAPQNQTLRPHDPNHHDHHQ